MVISFPDANQKQGVIIFYDLNSSQVIKKMTPQDQDLGLIGNSLLKLGKLTETDKSTGYKIVYSSQSIASPTKIFVSEAHMFYVKEKGEFHEEFLFEKLFYTNTAKATVAGFIGGF